MSGNSWRPPIEGSWYPAEAGELQSLLTEVSRKSERRTGEVLRPGALGYVVPHAAPMYSGTVAMAAYRAMGQQGVRRVVMLGFSHWQSHAGLWIPAVTGYLTPLGPVAVAREAVEALLACPLALEMRPEAATDHSIEVQLPLLKHALPEASVVPVYVGTLAREERDEAAQAIAPLLEDANTVLVASSDLTHYGRDFHYVPFPVDQDTPEHLRRLDHGVLESASSLDEDLFARELARTKATVCGHGPIKLLLASLSRANADEMFAETLDYQTSGDITNDWSHSVSYGALAFYPASAYWLSEADRAALLDAAYRTLAHYQSTGQRVPVLPATHSAALDRPAAVFVSLHREGQLRGCIGSKTACEPMAQAVPQMTLASATSDPRMTPVGADEHDIDIEISLLTPMKRISDWQKFRPGEHGAYLERNGHQAILLPQVATEWGLTAEQFLSELSKKAGLGARAFADPATKLWVFRAQVFGHRHH